MPLSLPDNNDNAYSDVHNLQDRRDKSWRYHLAAPVAEARFSPLRLLHFPHGAYQ
ncbi:hypothetical protein [Erwinia amylovora]|uniref:hypothetical protein n=1 Tax=Erwinia amylovora TaxID=552 RepID=UPI0014443118|nr:hypothetical protein [Erwinia amylovora]